MNRRHFIRSIAITGFANLFLPRLADRFIWRAPKILTVETNWIDVPWKPKDYLGEWKFIQDFQYALKPSHPDLPILFIRPSGQADTRHRFSLQSAKR